RRLMKNLGQLMKQAQEMQTHMQEAQTALGQIEVTGAAGGVLVQITLNGKGEARGVKIDPSLMKEGEAEVLEDLITAAHNDAKSKVEARAAEEMQKVTGGMKLPPGMKLPF